LKGMTEAGLWLCRHCGAQHRGAVTERCPRCLRRGAWVAAAPRALRWRWLRWVAVSAALVALSLLGLGWWRLGGGDATVARDLARWAGPAPLADREAAEMQAVLQQSEAVLALGERLCPACQPQAALPVLSEFLRARVAQGSLRVVEEGQPWRRPPLHPTRLVDGTAEALWAGEVVYLYALEVTQLASSLLIAWGVRHDFVLLPLAEPVLERVPAVAVRVEDAAGLRVLDPRSGRLVDGRHLAGLEPTAVWAQHEAMGARVFFRRGDIEAAQARVARALALNAAPWTVRATAAEVALAVEDVGAAAEWARGLAVEGDHPWAWWLEAQVAAQSVAPGAARQALLVERLRSLLVAFPAEARTAVALGDALTEAGRYHEALEAYGEALARDPQVLGAHVGLARLLLFVAPQRAAQHARQEIALQSDHPEAFALLTLVQRMRCAEGEGAWAERAGRALPEADGYLRHVAAWDALWQQRRGPCIP